MPKKKTGDRRSMIRLTDFKECKQAVFDYQAIKNIAPGNALRRGKGK
jgi:hypothetical protein